MYQWDKEHKLNFGMMQIRSGSSSSFMDPCYLVSLHYVDRWRHRVPLESVELFLC